VPDDESNMRGMIHEELERIIEALATYTVKTTNRLRTCTSFKFPHSLNIEEIEVHANW